MTKSGVWLVACILVWGLFHAPRALFAQSDSLSTRLAFAPGVTVTQIPNSNFKAYYLVIVTQPLDHNDATSHCFSQRIFVGIQSLDAPTVLATDGYGIDYAGKADYQHELAKTLQANLIVVEHRYFGRSQPETLDWNWLTMAQSAADLHAIKTLLDTVLVGKWISTGTSKGGQAAYAHRMHFPEDVSATVLYGTAVKKAPSILTSGLLKPLMDTPCGQMVAAFQKACFQQKDSLLPGLEEWAKAQKMEFGELELEVVLDYALLELPFSFWQSGGECETVPAKAAPIAAKLDFLTKTVSLKSYTPATRKRWAPAYYMFYHELGYYEYDLKGLEPFLKHASYPNSLFAPPGVPLKFDRDYLEGARDFLDSKAGHTVFFIYGEHDPWALQSVVTDNRFVVPGGSHRSKLSDLPSEQREALLAKIWRCLGK